MPNDGRDAELADLWSYTKCYGERCRVYWLWYHEAQVGRDTFDAVILKSVSIFHASLCAAAGSEKGGVQRLAPIEWDIRSRVVV